MVTSAWRLDTRALALLLALEAVVVSVAAAVPEARAAAVLHVEEPLHREVSARATILDLRARFCNDQPDSTVKFRSEEIQHKL